MGKYVEYTGNYVEIVNALNLPADFYKYQETKGQYIYEIGKDLGRTDYFSLNMSRKEFQNRIKKETGAQTKYSYTQGNLDGRLFAKNLVEFRPMFLETAANSEDNKFKGTFGITYIDDNNVQCGFAVSAYRDYSDETIPLDQREYFYTITKIENVNLEPEKRKVSVISNISNLDNHILTPPKSSEESNNDSKANQMEIDSDQIKDKIFRLINAKNLNLLLANLFKSDGSISINELHDLSSRFDKNTLDNRDFKLSRLNTFLDFAETYLQQDKELQNTVSDLKNKISSDVNFFKSEEKYQKLIDSIHQRIKNSINKYASPQTKNKLLHANELGLIIYHLELKFKTLDNVSQENTKRFKADIAILQEHVQQPFSNNITHLINVNMLDSFDSMVQAIDSLIPELNLEQFLELVGKLTDKAEIPDIAKNALREKADTLIITNIDNKYKKYNPTLLLDIILDTQNQEIKKIGFEHEQKLKSLSAPSKPKASSFAQRNRGPISIGIASIIGTIGIALTLTGILAPLGIALSSIGFSLGLLGLGVSAGITLASAGSIVANENVHKEQINAYNSEQSAYFKKIADMGVENERAIARIVQEYDVAMDSVSESIPEQTNKLKSPIVETNDNTQSIEINSTVKDDTEMFPEEYFKNQVDPFETISRQNVSSNTPAREARFEQAMALLDQTHQYIVAAQNIKLNSHVSSNTNIKDSLEALTNANPEISAENTIKVI